MAKVLLVTGGSRGIGAAVCRLGAREGYDVAINYAGRADAAEAVAAEVRAAGRRAITIKADITDEAAVAAMFDRSAAELGPVDGLRQQRRRDPQGSAAGRPCRWPRSAASSRSTSRRT